MLSVGDLISKNAFQKPDETAFIDGETRLDWKTFDARCWALAAAFQRLGVGRGDRVAYLGMNSRRIVECYYAPSRAGAIIAPLNHRLSVRELVECMEDSTPTLLIADPSFTDTASHLMAVCPSVVAVIHAGDGDAPDGFLSYEALIEAEGAVEPSSLADVAAQWEDTLLLFYTGGTTGRAKGVMLSHRNILVNAMGTITQYGLRQGDVSLIVGPLFHLAAGSRVYTNVLAQGASVILPKFDVEAVLETIQRERVSGVILVPTMVKMLLDHPEFDRFDLSSLRSISYGAAPMPPSLLQRTLQAFPGVSIVQGYGQTETSPLVSTLGSDDHDPEGPNAHRLLSVGRPVPYADIRIFDEEDRPLPPGERGEVVLRGPQVMKGYWNQPELTAETMRGGFHHTGDAGYLDADGYLFLAGRTKEMLISGGENVYPIETENVLSLHPAVAECAVIGLPHEKWGDAVHAVIRLRPGETVETAELIAFCRERLAHYKCPLDVTIWEGDFPLSSVNKVMKTTLRNAVMRGDRA